MLARVFLNSSLIKSENTKTYLLSCNHIQNPKTPLSYSFSCIIALVYFHASYLLYCIVIYFIAFVILFYLHSHLVLDNHSVELGIQEKEIVLQVAWRERRELFRLFPKSSI
jgi:hypothetical protein